jgi:hypothetical protein
MITRRLLLAGGGAVAVLGGTSAAAALSLPAMRRRLVQRVIYHYVPGIIFDGDDLVAFTDHINETLLSRRAGGVRRLIRYGVSSIVVHSWPGQRLVQPSSFMAPIDREIVSSFFLCTDFWQVPRRPEQRVSLVRSPDPYEAGCSNPLAILA